MTFKTQIKKFRYKKEFTLKLFCLLISFFSAMSAILICLTCADVIERWNTAYISILILGILFIITAPISIYILIKIFRKIILDTDIKFQQMEKYNNTLKELDKNRPFHEVLNDYIEYFNTSAEGEYSAKLLQKQAELDYMQSQINPHFLYNTLDSIRGQAINDNSEKTANMIQSLSKIFRYTIGKHDDIVTLKSELENIENYMSLLQYRFQNRFEWKIIIDDNSDILSCSIPKLTLQPIVENSLKHGIDSISDHGYIEIKIYSTRLKLIITISDNGSGMDIRTLDKLNDNFEKNYYSSKHPIIQGKSTGMGLLNVNARLKLLYGDSYGLTAFSASGSGAKIQVVLPLTREHEQTI